MAQLEDGNEKVTNSVIPNGTEAKVMRNLIENKGLLNGKGKLYAGTDDTTSTGAPVTTAIDPKNASEGSVLIKDSSQAGGWKVDKVGNNNIKSDDIYSVGGITSSGSIIIDPVTNDYNFRINNAVGGFTVYDDRGMAWLNADGSEGGFLNMPKTFTGGSSAGAGQTIATEEKVKEQLENGEIVAKTAQNATIAQYASTDTSKGTIEERLTSLGFKEGDFTLVNSDFYWTQSDRSEKNLGQTIKISREGNYCFLPSRLTVATGTYRAYALFKATTGSVAANTTIGYVPVEFAPETSVSFRTYNHPNSTSGNWYFFTLCGKDTDTPGELKTGLTTSFTAGTKYILAFVDTDDIQSSDSYRKGWYSKAGAILPNKSSLPRSTFGWNGVLLREHTRYI